MKLVYPLAAALLALPLARVAAAPVTAQDESFVANAAIGGLAEVQEGEMATTMGHSAGVKQFGQHMIADHTPNNRQLMALAKQKGIAAPTAVDAPHAQEAAALQQQTGAAFDRAYVQGQIAGHTQMQAVMQQEIQGGSDPDLRAFAQKTLPVVQEHLRMAQQLQGKV